MSRWVKYAGITAAALAGLLALAVIVVNLIPTEAYKSLIGSIVKSATGRELVVKGDLDVQLFRRLTFDVSDIQFANTEWGSRPRMVTAERLQAELALFPLLKGVLDVSLAVDGMDVLLERDKSGQGNWQFTGLSGESPEKDIDVVRERFRREGQAETSGGFALRPFIRKMDLNRTRIAFIDGQSGDRIHIGGEQLHIETAAERLTIDFTGDFNNTPLALSGGLEDAQFAIENQPVKVQLNGHLGSIKLAVQGTAGPLVPTVDLDINLAVNADSAAAFSPLAGRKLPNLGPLSVSARLTGREGKYAVSGLGVKVEDKTLSGRAAGAIADLTALAGLDLTARIDTGHLTGILNEFGYPSKHLLPDSVHAEVALAGSLQNLAVKQFRVKIQGKGMDAAISGKASNIMALEGLRADVSLDADSLDLLSRLLKAKLPPLEPLKAKGSLTSKGQHLGGLEIRAELSGKNSHAEVVGAIKDPLHLRDISADVSLEMSSLEGLSEYVRKRLLLQRKLLPFDSLKASARIISNGDTYTVKNINAHLAGDRLRVEATGSIGDLLKAREIDAAVNLDIQSLGVLSEVAQVKLPPLGPLKASVRFVSQGKTFEAKDIKANLVGEKIQATLAASVKDVLQLAGINADIHLSVDSLASLDPLVKQKLPASGLVSLESKISSPGGLETPVSIAAVVKSDGVQARLSGSIAEPLRAQGIDLALVAHADSLKQAGRLAGVGIQGRDPLELEARFTSEEKRYQLSDLHLRIGELDVKGHGAFQQPAEVGGRPHISAALHAGRLDANKLKKETGKAAKKDSGTQSDQGGEAVKKERIFPSDPLPVGSLKAVDANIRVTVDSLAVHLVQLEDLVAVLVLDNGRLVVEPITARVGKGAFGATVELDVGRTPASLKVHKEMTDATFRDFGGKVHLMADLNGSGDSIAAIMAGLNGQFELDIHDATLKKSFMTGFGTGLLDSLNPFDKDEETTELACAVILFDIKDGIADANRKIAAQMTDVTWLGSGEINLKTEEIDFGMSPKPRKGLGISVGSLANLVHLGGTLAAPKIELDPKDLVVKYGKYAAGMATGGITVAADLLWAKIRANADVCAQVLKKWDSGEKGTATP